MNKEQYIVDGKVYTGIELEEAFENIWWQLRRATDKPASSKARAAEFCLKCVDAGICPDRRIPAVVRACKSILKLAGR